MPAISLTDSFLDALADLDGADAKRVARFLAKLLRAPETAALHPEIVHDAADRTVRSLRVTRDMRAILHVSGESWVLLFVARHDRAYAWARDHCVECDSDGVAALLTTVDDRSGRPVLSMPCDSVSDLCRTLDRAGIAHDIVV